MRDDEDKPEAVSPSPDPGSQSGGQLFDTLNIMGSPISASQLSKLADRAYVAEIERRIVWHGHRIKARRRRYLVFKSISLTSAAAIPVVATIATAPDWVVAALGMVILISEGLEQLLKNREIALAHKASAAALARHCRKYRVAAEPYEDDSTRFRILVANVEQEMERYESAYLTTAKADGPAAAT
jgi:hypothetical protein